jgi:hypothetical protein
MTLRFMLRPSGRRPSLRFGICMTLLLALPAVVAGVSCGGGLGSQCILDSDCKDDLSCVFEFCHTPCNTSADCTGQGEQCFKGTSHGGCAVPPGCGPTIECPATAPKCAMSECHDTCGQPTDCLPNQTCIEGICFDPGVDAGPITSYTPDGGLPLGSSCSYNSECAAPWFCHDGTCGAECLTSDDCSGGQTCDGGACTGTSSSGSSSGDGGSTCGHCSQFLPQDGGAPLDAPQNICADSLQSLVPLVTCACENCPAMPAHMDLTCLGCLTTGECSVEWAACVADAP